VVPGLRAEEEREPSVRGQRLEAGKLGVAGADLDGGGDVVCVRAVVRAVVAWRRRILAGAGGEEKCRD